MSLSRQFLQKLGFGLALALLSSCARSSQTSEPQLPVQRPAQTFPTGKFPTHLSEWGVFKGRPSQLIPNDSMIPYDLNSSLFTDYASKYRTLWLPPGTSIQFRSEGSFVYPVGAFFTKTFYYPKQAQDPNARDALRLVETRVLVNTQEGWKALPYIWDENQTDAQLEVAGGLTEVEYKHPTRGRLNFTYFIPDSNQCKACHENQKIMSPIGPKAANLNRQNQLSEWIKSGILKGAPPLSQVQALPEWASAEGSVERKARAYLEVHCAHCHNSKGAGSTSGLYLDFKETHSVRLGRCKTPVAASIGSGSMKFDVVPGKPEDSILIHRMNSTQPKIMMPELGRSLVHTEGVELISQWIRTLPGLSVCEPGAPHGAVK